MIESRQIRLMWTFLFLRFFRSQFLFGQLHRSILFAGQVAYWPTREMDDRPRQLVIGSDGGARTFVLTVEVFW